MIDATIAIPPFLPGNELVENDRDHPWLFQSTGHLAVSHTDVHSFLRQELSTPVLDELYDHLWIVATKAADHIDALHIHITKGRTITVAEDPKLHLVWYYGIVFIKPIPVGLLNHQFWMAFLVPDGDDVVTHTTNAKHTPDELSEECRAALGFLRSYSYLIQHESDFHIAKEAHLIPNSVEYARFERFIRPFRHLDDALVAKRYHFGQFRLTRLNYALRIFRPPSATAGRILPWNYHGMYWQTGQFFQDLGAPLLFLFAAFSLILSAMQVVLAAVGDTDWPAFTRVSWGFSVATITSIGVVGAAAGLGAMAWWTNQLRFAYGLRRKQKMAKKGDSI